MMAGPAPAVTMRQLWWLFLIEGLVLVGLGVLAATAPGIASIAATIFFGWLLLISGFVGIATTLQARGAPGFIWSLISALIAIAAGFVLVTQPVQGALSLTIVLIAFFFVEGVATIFFALSHRGLLPNRWGWMFASGVLDIALAAVVLFALPDAAFSILGILLGVNLFFGGVSLIITAIATRAAAKALSTA